jgi:hypothetical protein
MGAGAKMLDIKPLVDFRLIIYIDLLMCYNSSGAIESGAIL